MTTTKVYLIKRPRTLPSGRKVHYWYLRWYGSDGKEVSESVGRTDKVTKKQARQVQADKQTAIGSGRIRRDRPRRMTLAEFIEHDRETISGDVRGSTLIEHGLAGKHAKAALGKDIELTAIGWSEVGRVKKHLADKGRSLATIRKTLSTLRAMFNRALKQGLVNSNPFAEQRLPRIESKPKRIFTKAEVAAMIRVSDLWWQAFIKLAVTSGLRRNELLNLEWRDLDFEQATVTVQAKRAESFEVNGRTYQAWGWSPKAKASNRTVPLPHDTLAMLRRLRMKMGASPFVFLSLDRVASIGQHVRNGTLPAKFGLTNNLLRRFADIQRRARGAAKSKWRQGCLHDLRRTYCTWMADAVPMHVLREWAGHSDIATTAAFYLSVSDDMAGRARKALSA